jgi:hypothetical protein
MNTTWVLIRSWHAVAYSFMPPADRYKTLCGRTAYGPPVDALPEGKSCETCLRIHSRKADQ